MYIIRVKYIITHFMYFRCRFGKHYELPLLLQSIFIIVAMFVMIKLCINVQNRTQIIKVKERVLTGKFNFLIFYVAIPYLIILNCR